MSVAVVAELFFKPEVVDGVKAGMAVALPETRAFEGCLEVFLHQDQDDPGHLVLIERWTSRERYQAYLDWRASQGRLGAMEGTTAPMKLTILDRVDV
jgi:quinol monooxygenase YgiN